MEPENRLVARGLETEWEKRLRDLAAAEAELERRQQQRPRTLSLEEKSRLRVLGSDLRKVWTASTTTDRDRKELLRTLLEEVIVAVDRSCSSSTTIVLFRAVTAQIVRFPVDKHRRIRYLHGKTPDLTGHGSVLGK